MEEEEERKRENRAEIGKELQRCDWRNGSHFQMQRNSWVSRLFQDQYCSVLCDFTVDTSVLDIYIKHLCKRINEYSSVIFQYKLSWVKFQATLDRKEDSFACLTSLALSENNEIFVVSEFKVSQIVWTAQILNFIQEISFSFPYWPV